MEIKYKVDIAKSELNKIQKSDLTKIKNTSFSDLGNEVRDVFEMLGLLMVSYFNFLSVN